MILLILLILSKTLKSYTPLENLCIHAFQSLIQIRHNILGVFDTGRKADQAFGDADLGAVFRGQGPVRSCGGMQHQGAVLPGGPGRANFVE